MHFNKLQLVAISLDQWSLWGFQRWRLEVSKTLSLWSEPKQQETLDLRSSDKNHIWPNNGLNFIYFFIYWSSFMQGKSLPANRCLCWERESYSLRSEHDSSVINWSGLNLPLMGESCSPFSVYTKHCTSRPNTSRPKKWPIKQKYIM